MRSAHLLKFLLQCRVGLLGRRQILCLQRLPELLERLLNGIAFSLTCMTMVMSMHLRGLILQVLQNRCIVLLRG